MRKFYIGFISLAAVLVIYLLFSRLSKTPPIDTGTGAEFADAVADSNLGGFDSKVGMLGEVGVETIQKAKYINYNKNQEVEREWGFERLLHEERDIWEITSRLHQMETNIMKERGAVVAQRLEQYIQRSLSL